MKRHLTIIALSIPVIFFLIWLQPLFVIRWFLSARWLIAISNVLILGSVGCGFYGLGRYILEVSDAVLTGNRHRPGLWLTLPLAIVVVIIITYFYLPLLSS